MFINEYKNKLILFIENIHPLTLPYLCDLPDEIKYNIQSYLVNECVYKFLQEYFQYLIYKKELYENFVMNNMLDQTIDVIHIIILIHKD